jgi:hypothetical protein
MCHTCHHTFSTQTFSPTYYQKRPELLVPAAKLMVDGACDRQIRRAVPANPHYAPKPNSGAAQSTITRLVPRLGREVTLFEIELLERARQRGVGVPERLCVDDFVTFAVTQLHQVAVPTVVGSRSAFVYQLDQAPHRAGGKLSARKETAADALEAKGAFPRGARAQAWTRVVDELLRWAAPTTTLDVSSDGDTAIAAAFERAGDRVRHRAFPNPERGPKGTPRSAEARARDLALQGVDNLHRFIRHSLKHDHRETIAFARSVNAMLGRKLMFMAWRNAIQSRREAWQEEGTPAMHVGILDRPLSWEELLEMRRFRRRLPPLPPGWVTCHDEEIPTIGQRPSRRRFPRYAR